MCPRFMRNVYWIYGIAYCVRGVALKGRPCDPSWIPRSSSSLVKELLAGAVAWQLQPRSPNGFVWVSDGFGSALAGAAATTQEPRTIAAPTSIFVIRTLGSKFNNPRADCFGFAINITTSFEYSIRLAPR
jgi:hypothetical protein